ncbi:hypothetical protein [Vibrio phage phiKT1028]|nr:hypothetical protein [Vibrio phage phiKT1028]
MRKGVDWIPYVVGVVITVVMISLTVWYAISYQVYMTQGRVTHVSERITGGSKLLFNGKAMSSVIQNKHLVYDYYIQTEVKMFKCRVSEEEHLEIGDMKDLSVIYGQYPSGEQNCLYVGI